VSDEDKKVFVTLAPDGQLFSAEHDDQFLHQLLHLLLHVLRVPGRPLRGLRQVRPAGVDLIKLLYLLLKKGQNKLEPFPFEPEKPSIRTGSGLTSKHQTKLEKLTRNEHSSLFYTHSQC